MLPPKCPGRRVAVLDDRDIDHMLRRVEELYLALVEILTVNRRFVVRKAQKQPSADILSMRSPRYPQSRGPDERGRL